MIKSRLDFFESAKLMYYIGLRNIFLPFPS